MSFDWIVEGRVAAMAAPWPEQIATLPGRGIRAVVSLTSRVPAGLERAGLAVLHVPVRDFHPPTQEQLTTVARFIDETIGAGGAVAVHCAAGLGRTGTVVAAWLTTQGLSARDAIGLVRQRRPGSVETRGQEQAIGAFAERGRADDDEASG